MVPDVQCMNSITSLSGPVQNATRTAVSAITTSLGSIVTIAPALTAAASAASTSSVRNARCSSRPSGAGSAVPPAKSSI